MTKGAGASAPLYEPVNGTPPLIDTPETASDLAADLANPGAWLALDTERADGIRFYPQAYLVQAKGENTDIKLFDPIALPDLREFFPRSTRDQSEQAPAPSSDSTVTWILHAAQEDLPSLLHLGLEPTRLFDTQLAGKLLGAERVNLGAMISDYLGINLAKNHSTENWSRRPLKESWLGYAALDVEYLIELAKALQVELRAANKLEWLEEECAYLLKKHLDQPRQFLDPTRITPSTWKDLKGAGKLGKPQNKAVAHLLFERRRKIASEMDIAEHRILSNQELITLARTLPRNHEQITAMDFAKQRAKQRYLRVWLSLIHQGCRATNEWRSAQKSSGQADGQNKKQNAPVRRYRREHRPRVTLNFDEILATKKPTLQDVRSGAKWEFLFPARYKLLQELRQQVTILADEHQVWAEILGPPAALRALAAGWVPGRVDLEAATATAVGSTAGSDGSLAVGAVKTPVKPIETTVDATSEPTKTDASEQLRANWREIPAWQQLRHWQKQLLEKPLNAVFSAHKQAIEQEQRPNLYRGLVCDSPFYDSWLAKDQSRSAKLDLRD